MINSSKRLLCGSKPVVLVIAVMAAMSVGGTAYATKLVTGAGIKDGSITTRDLSKGAKTSLKGLRGLRGPQGLKGPIGATGATGAAGAIGATGAVGAKGATGATGAAGVNGTNGTNGTNGISPVTYFAEVTSGSTFQGGRAHNISTVAPAGTGGYTVTLTGTPNTTNCIANATLVGTPTGTITTILNNAGVVTVSTWDSANPPVAANHAFSVSVYC